MRRTIDAAAGFGLIAGVSLALIAPAMGQTGQPQPGQAKPAQSAQPAQSAKPEADQVLATVNGEAIRMSDLREAAENLP